MQGKSVIIIGAGLAGLSAGCYARMNGFESRIFERHTVPGGLAAAWKRGGYLIDGGIHFIMGHKPDGALYGMFRDLGLSDASLYTEMTCYGRFIHQSAGLDMLIGCDLDELSGKLKALAPADSAAVDEIISGARAMQGRDLSSFGMGSPPELSSPLSRLKETWQMLPLVKYFTSRYMRPVKELTTGLKTPWLRDFFCSLFLPQSPVWFIMMILAVVADRQAALLSRGCLDFVLALAKRYRELGGEVTFKATVEKILVEQGRARGVRLSDGSQHRADYVISAGDSYNTIFRLLEGRFISDKIKRRHDSWPITRPFLLASFGVNREFQGEAPFSTIFLDEPIAAGKESVLTFFVRILNYSGHFAPAGKTLLQVEAESDFDYWSNLRSSDPAAYKAEKDRLAGEFLARLEKRWPGLISQVEMTDVATPYTYWRYTLNRDGSWGAWLLCKDTISERIERRLPGLAGFYLAGQWAMGGGVLPSLVSGRHAVQLMCRDENRKFQAGV